MKKKIVAIFVISVLFMSIMPDGVVAESDNVKVSLPNFKVSINGLQIENEYRQYPLILYKDITYFPMTFYDCRFLGIETKWDSQKGLEINKTGITGAYRAYKGNLRNGNIYTAAIPKFDVQVNGKTINNAEEEYPLLVFRDITYFPLTWRFGVEEYGWAYEFDSQKGLVINSSNQKLKEATLPEYMEGSITASDGYYYYGAENGAICQVQADNMENFKKVYQLPMWSYGDSYVNYELSKKKGEVWLTYHQGGAVMGRDYYIRLNPDGTAEEIETGYLTSRSFGDITVKANQGVPPGSNNLMIKHEGQAYTQIGNADYLYGWDYEIKGGSQGGSPSNDIYLKDDNIYLLAIDSSKETDASRIYKVNIKDGKTSRVDDLRANTFKMGEKNIYCMSESKLYSIPIDESEEARLITEVAVSSEFDIQVADDIVYYVTDQDTRLHKIGSDESLNPSGKVTGLKYEDGYVICTFEEDANNPYTIIIFDESGNVVFKSSDVTQIDTISIENSRLSYIESGSKNVYSTDI